MKRSIALLSLVTLVVLVAAPLRAASAALLPPKLDDSFFEKFNPKPAPQPDGLVLKQGGGRGAQRRGGQDDEGNK